VVGTQTGGSSEILKNDVNGLSFEVDDDASCGAALACLYGDPERAQRLRRAARLQIEAAHTVELMVSRVEASLKHLLTNRAERS
jgi:glycosyltransferase involved in cell wall biosynthesis